MSKNNETIFCSVGIVIVDSIYRLIRPYPDYYTHRTTEVHGLTKRAPSSPSR